MDTVCYKSQRPIWLFLPLLIFSFVFSFYTASAQADGAKLFKQNCGVCHTTGTNKLTGPGLDGVFTRVPQPAEAWLAKWIKNNDKLRKSGDAYANKIYAENGGSAMTIFENLSDEEITAIIAYFKNPPVEKTATPTNLGETAVVQKEGLDPLYVLLGVGVFLIIIISVLKGVKRSLKNLNNEKQGLAPEPEMGTWEAAKHWMSTRKRFVALCIIFLVCLGLKMGWYSLKEIGVYQGYKPEQPIKFSHKIHAGDNAINCQYCHSGVEKSKTAGIPSVNVCMNCHKGISKGPTTGTEEIAKIYEAAGFNPETQTYDKPEKPVKWVKVHNLQDFVFFSHQQHVKVGKQDCKNCHGDVATMATAEQFAPLTMQWCIDCHRTTEVPGMTAGTENPYYAEMHKKFAEKYKGQPITVAKMGGIECAKCHY